MLLPSLRWHSLSGWPIEDQHCVQRVESVSGFTHFPWVDIRMICGIYNFVIELVCILSDAFLQSPSPCLKSLDSFRFRNCGNHRWIQSFSVSPVRIWDELQLVMKRTEKKRVWGSKGLGIGGCSIVQVSRLSHWFGPSQRSGEHVVKMEGRSNRPAAYQFG
jgi:hypothetical protein